MKTQRNLAAVLLWCVVGQGQPVVDVWGGRQRALPRPAVVSQIDTIRVDYYAPKNDKT